MDHGQGTSCETLASVTLPPLPVNQSINSRIPGAGLRLPPPQLVAPSPPPRPSNTFYTPPTATVRNSSRTPSTVGNVVTSQQQLSIFSSLVGAASPPRGIDSPQQQVSNSSTATQNITLFTPRTVRQQNVYVDTPIKKSEHKHTPSTPLNSIKRLTHPRHNHHHTNNKSLPTVITQPLGANVCKPPPASSNRLSTNNTGAMISSVPPEDSIICGECGKCRCASCRSARPLPSAWVCDNKCLCSLEACVDTVTCMCCVKGGLYHCGEMIAPRGQHADTHEQEWVHHPCSCSSNNWFVRWGCLAAFSLVLPCLLCYPLLKGSSLLAERAYQAATRHGCSCNQDDCHRPPPTGGSPPHSSPPHSSPASSPSSASEDKRLLS